MEVTVENIAACKKKLSITISKEEIQAKLNERFTELEREAQVPGFRPGRAPRRLVEKRFHDAVRDEVRAKLLSETLQKALEEQKLEVIGEPDVDPDAIEMPDDGPMTFSIELEVRPDFQLPDYVGIPVDVARPTVADADVARALERLRESHGKLEEVPAGGEARPGDIITGNLAIQVGETLALDRQNVRMPVAAIAVEGVRLENLAEMLTGVKAGETRAARITIGQDAQKEDLRGKEAEVRVKVGEIRRVSLPDDAAILRDADYETLDALRAALRRQLDGQSDATFRRAQEDAVRQWLLASIPMELPDELAKRHANRLMQRHLVDLQYRGVPVEELEKQVDQIRGASTEQASRDLKLYFILDAIAKKESIEATDAEVDARVRYMAAQYGRREDRLREEMNAEGALDNLRGQIRDDKVVRFLLGKAKIAGAAPPESPPPPAEPSAAAPPAASEAAPPAETHQGPDAPAQPPPTGAPETT